MGTPTEDGHVTATLFVREELPRPARERADAVAADLRDLAAAGVLEELTVREWKKRVPVDDCDSEIRDTYLSFRAWADEASVSLAPFFATRECYTPEAGTHTDWLVVPAFALAVRVDGDLAAVYPHGDGDETATVEDGIDMLRSCDADSTTQDMVSVGSELA